MTTIYNDLSVLAAAAAAQDCTVHLHLDAQGKAMFSVGNSDIGAREFSNYFDALASVMETRDSVRDCVEQLAAAKAHDMLNEVLAMSDQAERVDAIKETLMELGRLPYPEAACAGFAVSLVNIIEVGLSHLPKAAE